MARTWKLACYRRPAAHVCLLQPQPAIASRSWHAQPGCMCGLGSHGEEQGIHRAEGGALAQIRSDSPPVTLPAASPIASIHVMAPVL